MSKEHVSSEELERAFIENGILEYRKAQDAGDEERMDMLSRALGMSRAELDDRACFEKQSAPQAEESVMHTTETDPELRREIASAQKENEMVLHIAERDHWDADSLRDLREAADAYGELAELGFATIGEVVRALESEGGHRMPYELLEAIASNDKGIDGRLKKEVRKSMSLDTGEEIPDEDEQGEEGGE